MSGKIDTRIVDMQFKSEGFRRGVSETQASLNDLKGSLQLDNMASGVDNISSKFTAFGAIGFAALNRITNAAISTGSKLVSSLIDPIKEGGLKRAKNIEQAKFQFEGLGMNVEQSMDDALFAVKGTAFGLDEAAVAASQFGASGIQSGDEMKSALRGIAGVAAMAGSSYTDMSNVFTKVAGQGRLMGDDLNRLGTRGINAAATLAEYFDKTGRMAGATEADIRSMVTKGQIDFKTFAAAMSDAFGEHATAANKTYTGSLSNMRAALARIGATSATFKLERHRILFNALTPAIDKVADALKPIQHMLGEMKAEAFEKIAKAITNWTGTEDAPSRSAEAFVRAGKNIAWAMRTVYLASKAWLAPIGKAFRSVFGKSDGSIMEGFERLTWGLFRFTSKLRPSAKAVAAVQSVFTGLFAVVKAVGSVIGSVLSGIASTLGKVFSALFPGKKALEGVISPTTRFADAIIALGDSLSAFINKGFDKAGDILTGLFTSLKQIFGASAGWVKENLTLKNIFLSLLGLGTFNLLQTLKNVSSNFSELVDTIKGLFKGDTAEKKIGKFGEVLESLKGALNTFVTGIRSVSLLAVAGAIMMLAVALEKISKIDILKIIPALATIGVMFSMLTGALATITKTLAGFTGKGLLTAGVTLVALAYSISVLADALIKVSKLRPREITKGLMGIAGVMMTLSIFLNKTKFRKSSIPTALTILAVAFTLKKIADALEQIGKMSFKNIARGLTGLGGALFIFSKLLSTLSGIKPWKALANGASLLLLSFTLKQIANALKDIGSLSWEEIARGLTGLAGALGSMALVVGLLGKVGKKKTLAGATSILIMSFTLKQIANALKDIGSLSWEEIAKGITGMVGALAAVGAAAGIVGYFTHVFGLLGAVSIWIGVQSLQKIANALADIAELSWNGIAKGLVGLLGALAIVGAAVGVVGYFTHVLGLLGAVTIWVGVQSLQKLAEALQMIGSMSWGEITRGIAGLLGALTMLSIGMLLNVVSGIGALNMGPAVKNLLKLAEAIKTFADIPWRDLQNGLSAMMQAMGTIAIGSLLNTFSGLGAGAIAKVAGPMGQLADAMVKWKDVEIPANLSHKMASIATAVMQFSFSSIGAYGIRAIGDSLGPLADGVKKWDGVKVPANIQSDMFRLSAGVEAFTWSLMGGISIRESAAGLGDLAGAMMKWDEVKIPANIGTDLSDLASGVNAFTLSFAGGWSMGAAADGLISLSDAVKAWTDIELPANLVEDLKQLGFAIETWTWNFVGAYSMGEVAEPMKALAESTMVWNEVELRDGLTEDIKDLATALQEFSWMLTEGLAISALAEPFGLLAESTLKWKDVEVPETIGDGLTRLSNGLEEFKWMFTEGLNIGILAGPFGVLAESVMLWDGVTVPSTIEDDLGRLGRGLKTFRWMFTAGSGLEQVAEPFGALAASVTAWADVEFPENIETDLGRLSRGLQTFQMLGGSGENLDALVDPFRRMAQSIISWQRIEVPENIDQDLTRLATGLSSFGPLMNDGANMEALVDPFRRMAQSVTAWQRIEIPEKLEEGLLSLGNGLSSFTTLTGAGVNLEELVEPLRKLSISVSAWHKVQIPETLSEGLASLATGVQGFGTMATQGENLDSVVEPLRKLAVAISAWRTVVVPEGMGNFLGDIAIGLQKFFGMESIGQIVNDITTPLRNLGNAMLFWNQVEFPEDISTQLSDIATGLEEFINLSGTDDPSSVIMAIRTSLQELNTTLGTAKTSVTEFTSAIATGFSGIGDSSQTALDTFNTSLGTTATALSELSSTAGVEVANIQAHFSTLSSAAGTSLVMLGLQVQIGKAAISSAFTELAISLITQSSVIITAISTMRTQLTLHMLLISTTVRNAITGIVAAFRSMGVAVVAAASTAVQAISSAIRGIISSTVATLSSARSKLYSAGYSVGLAVAQGMISGINAGAGGIAAAARNAATRAYNAARSALEVESPSKKFQYLGDMSMLGMIQGIEHNENKVEHAAEDVAHSAVNAMRDGLARMSQIVSEDVDLSYTITPVLDLSQIQSQTQGLHTTLPVGLNVDASKGMIFSAANERRQLRELAREIVKEQDKQEIVFNQYNSSPKALSNVDIYRRTRNGLALLRENMGV